MESSDRLIKSCGTHRCERVQKQGGERGRKEGPHDNGTELLSESLSSGVATLKEGVVLADKTMLYSFSMEQHCIITCEMWGEMMLQNGASEIHCVFYYL